MKALIPAAGLGTRWYPWSIVAPKELLPLGSYPAIHYVLEEITSSGICEIGIIINKAKHVIKEYVYKVWAMAHPEAKITWFYQPIPQGVGGALFCAKDWIENEPTAVLYPDEIHPVEGGLTQLYKAYQKSPGSWIGITLNKQKRNQASYEIIKTKANVFRVNKFCDESHLPEIGYGTGRYILGSGLVHLTDPFLKSKQQYWNDDKIFEPLFKKEILGIELNGPIFDVGTPENYKIALTMMDNS